MHHIVHFLLTLHSVPCDCNLLLSFSSGCVLLILHSVPCDCNLLLSFSSGCVLQHFHWTEGGHSEVIQRGNEGIQNALGVVDSEMRSSLKAGSWSTVGMRLS